MCKPDIEKVIADNKPPEKKPLLAGEDGYTGAVITDESSTGAETLPVAPHTQPVAYSAPHVTSASKEVTAAFSLTSDYQKEFLSLIKKTDVTSVDKLRRIIEEHPEVAFLIKQEAGSTEYVTISNGKGFLIALALTTALEKGVASPEAIKILTSIKDYVSKFGERNTTVTSEAIVSVKSFLYTLLLAIKDNVFSKDEDIQTAILNFVSKTHTTFNTELINVSNGIDPFNMIVGCSKLHLVKIVLSSELLKSFEELAEDALTRSKTVYCNASIKNTPIAIQTAKNQIDITSEILNKFPQLSHKILAQCLVNLPDSIGYAMMLLDKGANPLLPAKGQSRSVFDHALSVISNADKTDKKDAAIAILKHALKSKIVQETIKEIQSEFPFLIDELKTDNSIESIISKHANAIGNKANYLKSGVYHFLKCVKDFAHDLDETEHTFMETVNLPLLLAISKESSVHGTLVPMTHATGASLKTTAPVRFTPINLPKPSEYSTVYQDSTAQEYLPSVEEGDETDSPTKSDFTSRIYGGGVSESKGGDHGELQVSAGFGSSAAGAASSSEFAACKFPGSIRRTPSPKVATSSEDDSHGETTVQGLLALHGSDDHHDTHGVTGAVHADGSA